MDIPDVVGYTLVEALTIVQDAGFEALPIVTAPPREKGSRPEDDFRVVRVRQTGENKLELLICRLTDH